MAKKIPNGNDNVVSITELLTELAGRNVPFVAAGEATLPEQLDLVFDGSPDARDQAYDYLASIAGVEIENTTLPLYYEDTLFQTTYGRVPLYIPECHPELDSVSIDSGRQNLRDAIEGDWDFTPPQNETIQLRALLEKFVSAGAISVTADSDLLERNEEPLIAIKVGLETQKVYNIAGPFDTVRLDGSTYNFHFEPLVTGGPAGEFVAFGLYYDDSIRGIEPKTVDEGLDDLRRVLNQEHAPTEA